MLICAICVKMSLGDPLSGKDMSSEKPVQAGVDDAKQAVTVYDGMAVCVTHLHERLEHISLEHFMSDLDRQLSGRRN